MEFIEGAFQYKMDENKCVLTKLIRPDYVLEVPAQVRGKPVREIGKKAFYRAKDIAAVILPYTISYIRNSAFAESDISSITRKANKNSPVLYIDSYAFCKCNYLRTVEFGGKTFLESNGYQFHGCGNLERIDSLSIFGNIPVGAFVDTDIRLFCFNNGIYVSQSAFTSVPLKKIYVNGNMKYAPDFLSCRPNLEIVCEPGSPISELAYEGYNIQIKQN